MAGDGRLAPREAIGGLAAGRAGASRRRRCEPHACESRGQARAPSGAPPPRGGRAAWAGRAGAAGALPGFLCAGPAALAVPSASLPRARLARSHRIAPRRRSLPGQGRLSVCFSFRLPVCCLSFRASPNARSAPLEVRPGSGQAPRWPLPAQPGYSGPVITGRLPRARALAQPISFVGSARPCIQFCND